MAVRLQHLVGHLTAATAGGSRSSLVPGLPDEEVEEYIASLYAMRSGLEDRRPQHAAVREALPGPHDDMSDAEVARALQLAFMTGGNNLMFERYAHKYGVNFCVTMLITPKSSMPYNDYLVVIGDSEDAVRILTTHVKKAEIYGVAFLGEGVLSTRDNALWQEQRKHLQEAFLPGSNLSTAVFPKSLARAEFAARQRLPKFLGENRNVVEMNDFILHETFAQLQIALIGLTDEHTESVNDRIRQAHEGSLKFSGVLEPFPVQMERRKAARKTILDFSEEVLRACPAGPLGQRLMDNCPFGKDDARVKRDTVSTLSFAGYDTTGNLITFALFEMCRNPVHQKRVREEVDRLYELLAREKRDMVYADLLKLPFLSRVLTETLRLWPSVPNGTFREFEFDDQIKGRNGRMVTIPKGTQCNIPVWLLHTSKALWGDTVEEFNPDRDFLPSEVWNGQPLAAWNPTSHRYMPFTAGPRDCIGKNFAQMEARLILMELVRHWEFALAEPTLSSSSNARARDVNFIACNNGTMSPRNGIHCRVTRRVL